MPVIILYKVWYDKSNSFMFRLFSFFLRLRSCHTARNRQYEDLCCSRNPFEKVPMSAGFPFGTPWKTSAREWKLGMRRL